MEQFPVRYWLRMICLKNSVGPSLPADSAIPGRIVIRHAMTAASDLTRRIRPAPMILRIRRLLNRAVA